MVDPSYITVIVQLITVDAGNGAGAPWAVYISECFLYCADTAVLLAAL
jgi:hypothetical protein